MTRPRLLLAGSAVLLAVWIWPLGHLGIPPFTRHMTMHMAVVAVASPLVALGLAGSRLDPVLRAPALCSPLVASMLELVGVWAWHVPSAHHLARTTTWGLLLEQATFLLSGLYLWTSALGGAAPLRRARAFAGITGLLLTSMHMTLLGVLLALPDRLLYAGHHGHHGPASALSPLHDQQLGGVMMLFVGGVSYLAGGVALVADALARPSRRRR